MYNSQDSAGQPGPTDNYDPSKMDPALLRQFLDAACKGQFGPQAKQMAEAAKGVSQGPPQGAPDGQQPPQQDQQQGAPPPQPGRTLASRHIFGRGGMSAPQAGNDNDDDDQQQAPMGARGIFGR